MTNVTRGTLASVWGRRSRRQAGVFRCPAQICSRRLVRAAESAQRASRHASNGDRVVAPLSCVCRPIAGVGEAVTCIAAETPVLPPRQSQGAEVWAGANISCFAPACSALDRRAAMVDRSPGGLHASAVAEPTASIRTPARGAAARQVAHIDRGVLRAAPLLLMRATPSRGLAPTPRAVGFGAE